MALPIPLSALQRYVPALFLLLLNTYGCPVNRASLSLPLANTFVQVMFGVGTPATLQSNVMSAAPSTTTWSGLGLLKLGRTKQTSIQSRTLHSAVNCQLSTLHGYMYILFNDHGHKLALLVFV